MNRVRRALLAAGIAALALPARAQAPRRVGVLSLGSPPPGPLEPFAQELARLGYVEGRNLALEWRFAGGSSERVDTLARELAAMKVDVIFAVSTPAALAAKRATSTIPIVFARVADPVHSRLVASLARPGGNVTGLASTFAALSGKQLEHVKLAVPSATRVAFLWNKRNEGAQLGAKHVEEASRQLGLQLVSLGVERPEDLQAALESAKRAGVSAVVIGEDLFMASQKTGIVALGAAHGLPLVASSREFVEAGSIFSYGPDIADIYRRAARYVDRILKGAKPAELPVEQPTKYDFIVNLKAAQALGLTIPSSLLLRADTVIR